MSQPIRNPLDMTPPSGTKRKAPRPAQERPRKVPKTSYEVVVAQDLDDKENTDPDMLVTAAKKMLAEEPLRIDGTRIRNEEGLGKIDRFDRMDSELADLKQMMASTKQDMANMQEMFAGTLQRALSLQEGVIHIRRRNLGRKDFQREKIQIRNSAAHDPSAQDMLALMKYDNLDIAYRDDFKALFGCTMNDALRLQAYPSWIRAANARSSLKFNESVYTGKYRLQDYPKETGDVEKFDSITQEMLAAGDDATIKQLCAEAEDISIKLLDHGNFWRR